jgi:hypothetical protein
MSRSGRLLFPGSSGRAPKDNYIFVEMSPGPRAVSQAALAAQTLLSTWQGVRGASTNDPSGNCVVGSAVISQSMLVSISSGMLNVECLHIKRDEAPVCVSRHLDGRRLKVQQPLERGSNWRRVSTFACRLNGCLGTPRRRAQNSSCSGSRFEWRYWGIRRVRGRACRSGTDNVGRRCPLIV